MATIAEPGAAQPVAPFPAIDTKWQFVEDGVPVLEARIKRLSWCRSWTVLEVEIRRLTGELSQTARQFVYTANGMKLECWQELERDGLLQLAA